MITTNEPSNFNPARNGAFIVNYPGIGDSMLAHGAIWDLANDQRFANGVVAHPSTALFNEPALSDLFPLPESVRLYDKEWYAFETLNWDAIIEQADRWNIRTFVNVQNEGPLYDLGYYRFKQAFGHRFEFWDFNFDELYTRQEKRHVAEDIHTLLKKNRVIGQTDRQYSNARRDSSSVSIFIGGSEPNKRWPIDKWRELIQLLATAHRERTFTVLTGSSETELFEAKTLSDSLWPFNNVVVSCPQGLNENLRELQRAGVVITHDSYPIHFAALNKAPAVGIYFSTDPVIWGSWRNPHFRFVASCEPCSGAKMGTGNCVHFHSVCPNIEQIKDSVTVDAVYAFAVAQLQAQADLANGCLIISEDHFHE